MDEQPKTVDEAATSITNAIMQEIRAVRFQNAEMREAMKAAGLTPPSEDPNYEALVKAIEEVQNKQDSIEGKEGKFRAGVYRDSASYCLAAKRRGDIRWNEACDSLRTTLLGLAEEHDPTPKEIA